MNIVSKLNAFPTISEAISGAVAQSMTAYMTDCGIPTRGNKILLFI